MIMGDSFQGILLHAMAFNVFISLSEPQSSVCEANDGPAAPPTPESQLPHTGSMPGLSVSLRVGCRETVSLQRQPQPRMLRAESWINLLLGNSLLLSVTAREMDWRLGGPVE